MIDGTDDDAGGAGGAAGGAGGGAGAATGADAGAGGAAAAATAGDDKAKDAKDTAPAKSAFQQRMEAVRGTDDLESIRTADKGATDGADDTGDKGADADQGDEPITRESDGATWVVAEDGQTGRWEVDGEEVEGAAPEEWAPADPDEHAAKVASRAAAAAKAKPADKVKPVKPLVFKVPGRADGDKDVDVVLDRAAMEKAGIDPDEAVERLAQLRNGYKRNAALEKDRREFETREAQFNDTMAEVDQDPRSYMLDHVKAEHHKDIVLDLLSRMKEEDYDAVAEHFDQWQDDPSKRRTAAADAREAALERKDKRTTAKAESKARTDYTNALHESITSLMPEGWDEAQANEFYDFAGLALQRWGSAQPKGTRLDPKEAPALLQKLGVLKRFELALPDGDAADAGKGKTRTPSAKPSSKAPAKPASAADREARARQTAKDLEARHTRRQEAAAVPAGAGAAAASAGFPKGQTFMDRMKAIRKKIGV